MATRSETTEARQQGQQSTQQQSRTGTGNGGETGRTRDRERGLQTGREGSAQTGMVRSGRPGSALTEGWRAQSPFALMRRVMEDMDRVFEDFGLGGGLGLPVWGGFGRDLWSDTADGGRELWAPAIEVFEKGNNLVVRAELPGLSKDDVNVNVTNEAITIEGERRHESEDRGEGFYRSERSYGRFFRSIPLPEGAEADKAEATFKDGVLEIALPTPKREQQRGRRIQIR